jgi:hypothetical protein
VGKLYTSTLVSINQTEYTVEIWDKVTTPTVKTLLMTGEGFTISRDGEGDKTFENPIRSSKANVTFSINDPIDIEFFQNMGVADEGQYYMLIKKGVALHWIGLILADQNQWERTPDEVYLFNVASVDALQLLENYEIDSTWFDSDGRILISKFVYRVLDAAGMTDFWQLSGASNSFFADALSIHETTLQSFTTERIGKQKISINAFYRDFNSYTKYTFNSSLYVGMLINCKEALEKILIAFNARIILENGMYWIYNPLSYANYSSITYNRYNITGDAVQLSQSFQHGIDISLVNTVRPKWAQFPVITHQAANKSIVINHTKYASKNNLRSFDDRSVNRMIVGPLRTNTSTQIISEAIITGVIPSAIIASGYDSLVFVFRARTYSFDGTTYKYFDQSNKVWTSGGPPGFTKTEITIPLFYSKGFPKLSIPYNYKFEYENGADYVYTEFEMGATAVTTNKGNSQPGILINIPFYGYQVLYQNSESQSQVFSNTNNLTASEVSKYDVDFYDLYGLDAHGTILVDNNTGDYVPSDAWSAFPTGIHNYVNDLISINGYSSMAVYNKAVQTISGDWYDKDEYNVIKSLQFDNGVWIWQGGVFNAQSNVYSGEWLRIGSEFDLVVVGGEEDEQEGFDNDQFSQGLVALDDRVTFLYDQNQLLTELLQYNVYFAGVQSELLPPANNITYGVAINYDTATELLTWNIQELGKTQSLPGGTHDLDVTAELVICDSTEETVIVNLPDPATVKGRKYHFKKIASSHSVQLNGTIDTLPLYSFNGKDDCKVIMSDGTQYWLVAYYHK